jgi:hypothetical protein
MSSCPVPFTLGPLKGLNQSQLAIYNKAWDDFNRVQSLNSNTSTVHSTYPASKLTQQYYTFVSYAEKNSFLQGQFLHTQVYPNSNWDLVQEN